MKNYLLTLLTCLFMAAVANAEQIFIYKTYQDYKNNTPTIKDGDIDGFPDSSPALVYKSGIRIKSNGKKKITDVQIFGVSNLKMSYSDVLSLT